MEILFIKKGPFGRDPLSPGFIKGAFGGDPHSLKVIQFYSPGISGGVPRSP